VLPGESSVSKIPKELDRMKIILGRIKGKAAVTRNQGKSGSVCCTVTNTTEMQL
jgi:hypothetical protein